MYKGFKKYFSNGAGGVQSHASAKAATVNAPRTETTTKAAEYTKAPRQGLSRGSANSQNLDKTKTVATQKANLTSALEKGNLNITGGAYYGLDKMAMVLIAEVCNLTTREVVRLNLKIQI